MKIIRSGDTRFDFTDENGRSPAKAVSVGVTSFAGGGPIWWIVSDEFSDYWIPEGGMELTTELAEKGQALLESLRQKQPRSTGRSLFQVTYGRVPDGFRQVTPDVGPPEPLQPGARYVLHIVGDEFATLEFIG